MNLSKSLVSFIPLLFHKKNLAGLPFKLMDISVRVSFEGLVKPIKTIFFSCFSIIKLALSLIIMEEDRKTLTMIYHMNKCLGQS